MDVALVLAILQVATALLASQAPSHSPGSAAFLARLEPRHCRLLPQAALPVPLVNIQVLLSHKPALHAAPTSAPPSAALLLLLHPLRKWPST